MRTCKNRCRWHSGQPRNYNDGRKSCRLCGIFIKTLEVYCPCCRYPLAYKGRANQTQLDRRAEKKILMNVKILNKNFLSKNKQWGILQ